MNTTQTAQHIDYTGPALDPHRKYWWTLRVHGSLPKPTITQFAPLASFSTGVWGRAWKAKPIWLHGSTTDEGSADTKEDGEESISSGSGGLPSEPHSAISGPSNLTHVCDNCADKGRCQFAVFRKTLAVPADTVLYALLFITAVPSNKLLTAYKLYINGKPMGTGPGRATCRDSSFKYCNRPTIPVDSYDISEELRVQAASSTAASAAGGGDAMRVVITVECFGVGGDAKLLVEGHIRLTNGTAITFATGMGDAVTSSSGDEHGGRSGISSDDGDDGWRGLDTNSTYNPISSTGTQYYDQPMEMIDARHLHGSSIASWRAADFDDSQWAAASQTKNDFSYPLECKVTAPVEIVFVKAASVKPIGDGHYLFASKL
jgi:hypothetical protein